MDLPPDPSTGPDPGGDGLANGAPSRNRGGRRTAAEEVTRHLAEAGLLAVPRPDPAAGGEAPPALDSAPAPFDETGTRQTLELLVEAYAETKSDALKAAAVRVLGDDAGSQFAAAHEMGTGRKSALVGAGVEVARRHGVGVNPEVVLVALVLNEVREFRSLRADLARLAAARPPAP